MQEANETLLKKTLHIGCTITLSYCDEAGQVFYACCEGYTSTKLRLRLAAHIKEHGKLSSCLFKIVPPFQYQEYQKSRQLYNDKCDLQQITSIDQRDSRLEFPKQIKAMDDESTLNSEQFNKLKGQSIFYGQTVQFIHEASNKYFSFNKKQVSDYESDGWKATLKSEHAEDTCFKFMSSFSFQQETGGYIFDQDTVSIVSLTEQEPGLHASIQKLDRNNQKKRELNVTTEKYSFWKIKIFSKYNDNPAYLQVFDVVWINYAESNLNLIVQKYALEKDKKYLKFEQGEDTQKYNKFVGDSNGMFVIENVEDPFSNVFEEGGFVQWNKPYRLRHLTSKYYLQIEQIMNLNILGSILIAQPNVAQSSQFEFEMIYSTINSKEMALEFMEKDSYFRLNVIHQEEHLWFRVETTPPNNIYIIEGENFIEDISIPVFELEKKDENVFKLARASPNDVRLTQYLLSCMKILNRSEEYLSVDLDSKEMFQDIAFQNIYKKLTGRSRYLEQCLFDLSELCYNKLQGYVAFEAEYDVVYPHIQNLLKEQYTTFAAPSVQALTHNTYTTQNFFEALVRIIVLCFPSKCALQQAIQEQTNEKVTTVLASNQKDLLEKQIIARFVERKKIICQKAYKLIQVMCESNTLSQQYCAKYLPIFSIQSMYLQGPMKTIISIIRGYEELLLNLNKDNNISNLNNQQLQTLKSPQAPGKTPGTQKARKTLQTQQVKKQVDYYQQYEAICKQVLEGSPISSQWDLILFFSKMLQQPNQSFQKRIDILEFLKETAQFEGKGININQELSYKYILSGANVFDDEILIRIKSDGPQLKVYRGGDEKTLLDYFHQHRQQQQMLDSPHNKRQNEIDPHLIPYICESMQLYSVMSNSRNYTWKKFAENFFNVESLIENIQNVQYDVHIRSIICNLLNKLYVDQEPRRVVVWPELCKVVRTDKRSRDLNNTMLSEGKYQQKDNVIRADPVDLGRVKEKILGYLREISKKVDYNSESMDLNLGPNEKKPILMQIHQDSPSIYNNLTIEVIRLFKLLVQFGKYSIRLGKSPQETLENNQELFQNLRSLVCLLEYNVLYPETRKILMKKRSEDNQADGLDLFQTKKKKKQFLEMKIKYGGDDDMDDPSQGEGFQKLSQLQSIKMNEFMYKQHNPTDTIIKLEICEILDQYLDSKMDFYLNNLKLIFSEWVIKLELFDQVYREELDIDQANHREKIQIAFKEQIKEKISTILPKIMLTGTSVDDTDLKKPDQNQFMAFINIANKLKEQSNTKELEALNLESITSFSVFPSLISIFCLNQDIQLETKILQILTRLYNQRFEFAELSSQLLILFDDTNINLFKKCKKKILVLGKCVDESETWVQNLGQDEQHIHTLETVQEHFEFFTELLFKGSYINDQQELEKGQQGLVDSIRQDIMKHLKVDKLGVDLIKDAVFMVEQETDPEMLLRLQAMFRVCLRFLTLFVKNNPNNQLVMSKHIIALIANLNTDLGQVELLCEIFRNNKGICLERSAEVIDDFVRLILTNGRQQRYLEFFLIVTQIKTDYIPQNQKAVLNLFIDPRFKNQLFYMIPADQQQKYPIFDFEPKKSSSNRNYKDEPYIYHAKFIEVCAACTIGKEGLLSSENKLKAQLTFKYIMDLLLENDIFTQNMNPEEDQKEELIQFGKPKQLRINIYEKDRLDPEGITNLKPSLLDLLFYTYLESDQISDEIFQCFGDINNFIKKERIRIQTYLDSQPYYQDYLFNNLMLVLNGFIKVFNRELGQQAIQTGSVLQKQSIQFQSELEQMRHAMSPPFTSRFKLSKRQETLLDLFLKESIMQEDQNKMNMEDQAYMEYLRQEKMRAPTLKKLPRKQKTIQTSKRELSIDQIWKELWNIFLAEFLNSTELQKHIEEEQLIFAKAVYKADEIFREDKTVHQQINRTSIFKRLIAFLEKSSAGSNTITTFKLILQVLRNYIAITDIDPELPEDQIESVQQQQKIDNQNFLNANNAMQMTLTLLSDSTDPVNAQLIFNDLICFGIDLLDGGNNDVQKAVWSFFQNFPLSEVFFLRLHNVFQNAIINMKKVDELQQLFKFQEQSDLINNILRFLQLFAEGHYTVLQEYMHLQTYNHHSYDLIQDFIDLLSAYMSTLNEDYFQNMIQNFDTITEYIQGPCRTNQTALIQANFLDLANQLYGFDELLTELQIQVNEAEFNEVIELTDEIVINNYPQHRRLPRWMYSMLKYKCSVTLISLLEARESEDIVYRMMKSLNMETIKLNISNVFYIFQMDYNQVYSEDIFTHYSLQYLPENEEQISFIMETGFNLYFLYTIFQKIKNPLLGRKAKGEDEDEIAKQFKNNPLFKLIQMGNSIVQSLQDSAMQAVRMAMKSGQISPKQKMDNFLKTRENLFVEASKFFFSKTAKIEIMFDDKNLEETYFFLPPYCNLDDESKTKFNESANRASNKAKVTSLVAKSKEIIKTMKINYQIQVYLNKVKTLEVIIENIDLLRDIEFFIALVINILIFIFYKKKSLGDQEQDDGTKVMTYSNDDDFEYQEQINILGTISIVLSILIVAFFMSRNAPLLLEKAWSGVGKDKLNLASYLIRLLKTVYYFLSDFFALYYIMYGAAAVLGRFLHPFFFSFHLFEVMIRFPVLLNVVKSVWIPKTQILYTGLLLLIFMYVFTVFGYLFLYESQQPGFCDSMWICFLTVLDSAFKYDSGIGGQLKSPYESDPGNNGMLIVRFLYDNIFNILVIIVMLNIVSGIIIDTFGELREQLMNYRNDLENLCFICGHDKETIEKESTNLQNFVDHIRYEHYQWNYLYYVAYLSDKNPTEYTGVESYVADKLQKEDISWFPLNKAMCLKKNFGEVEGNQIVESLEAIREQSSELQEQLNEISREVEEAI